MLHDPELHYLDNAATTIVAPEVADVIDKAMREHWANPSSLYAPGARSEEALNAARAAVARTLGCKSKELYFTSCGSEGNNLALLGAAQTRTFGKGIVVSGFEHPSVQRPLERLAAQGYNVTVVKPQADGTLDINKMLDAVDKNTILVACMMVNNEIGTRNDVERLAAEVKRRNSRTIVHVDAVQAWMRVPIKLDNIDTMAVSGHKIHAPKGVGALYLSDRLVQAFQPPYLGGEQERGLRPGTENLPYALGLAAAATRRAGSLQLARLGIPVIHTDTRNAAGSGAGDVILAVADHERRLGRGLRLGKRGRNDLGLCAARAVVFAADHAVKEPLKIEPLQDRARHRRGLPGRDRDAKTVRTQPLEQFRNAGIERALIDADRQIPLPVACDRRLRLLGRHGIQLRERIEQRRTDKLAQTRRVRLMDAEALERILHAAQDTFAGVKQRTVKIK